MATKTASVVFDVVSWREPIEGTVPLQYTHESAYRGQTVDLPVAEVKRLVALGAVVEGEDVAAALAAWDASAGPAPATEDGDAELAALSAADLIAYVNQHPGEAARVYALEAARRSPRKTVISGIGYDPETGEPLAAPL